MVSRKTHTKSRLGCKNCKIRRIKCDESKPSCSNCLKHSIVCDFAKRTAVESATRGPRLPKSVIQPSGDLQYEEFQLLHHYSVETCFTLSDRSQSQTIWQKTVPQEAFSHPFLMRGILAISALHLSHLMPEEQDHYRHIAEKHQSLALSLFRNAMQSITSDNCTAFFASSSLIVVYAFASLNPSKNTATASNERASLESLALIRGVNSILQTVWPWIKAGSLGDLLEDRLEIGSCSDLPEALETLLGGLFSLCGAEDEKLDEGNSLRYAIVELRSCYEKFLNKSSSRCEVSVAFIWPALLRSGFIASIQALQPEGLVILAFYCVILHHLDGYWWMQKRGHYIFNTIRQSLNETWSDWIQWPASVFKLGERPLRPS